jgi:hypothetical protein
LTLPSAAQKTVMTDFDKTLGQNRQRKTTDKLPAYILRRIFNLIDQNELKQYLKVLALLFGTIKGLFKAFCDFIFIATIKSLFAEKDIIVV